jgi:hypothetical protein
MVRRLRSVTNIEVGVVVAAVPPEMRRGYELTWEILLGLGKRTDVTGAGRQESLNWEVLAAWVLAQRIEHIVLIDAQWLRRTMIEDVIGLAAVTATTLWLVAQHPLEDEYEAALSNWPTEPAEISDLKVLIERALNASPIVDARNEFPVVPSDNFVTFRSEAKRRLSPDSFNAVDARYVAVYRSARTWCVESGQGIDEDTVLAVVRAELHDCACADEMLTALRAIQAALFRSGWLLSVDLIRLVVTAERAARAAIQSPATWVRLRAYREPFRGAACALAASELSLSAIGALSIGAVEADGSGVRVERSGEVTVVRVPEGAAVYLRAQLLYRAIQGASDGELLFANDEGPMESRYLADAIRCPIGEVGVPLYSQQVDRADLHPVRWGLRWGLSVQEL